MLRMSCSVEHDLFQKESEMQEVLEVWSGEDNATVFVRPERVDCTTVARMESGLKTLFGSGMQCVILGFDRVQILDDDAAELLKNFGSGLGGPHARIAFFGLHTAVMPEATAVPMCIDEEAAHRWMRDNRN